MGRDCGLADFHPPVRTGKMVGFYERRWSRSALWCQRLAIVTLFYFVIAVLLHRFGQVTTPQLFWLLGFGLLLLVVSLLLAVRGAIELWNEGRRGGRATVRGVVLCLLMLLPFGWAAYEVVRLPPVSDVSTDAENPPAFIEIGRLRAASGAQGMNPLAAYGPEYGEMIFAAYPRIGPRRYNAGAERVYASVRAIVADRGWTVVTVRGAPIAEPPAPELAPGSEEGEAAPPPAANEGIVPQAPLDIEIEAIATSMVFGFKNDVAIRILSEEEATLVDMRASARYGRHDFGSDARLIDGFLTDLDAALLGVAGEG